MDMLGLKRDRADKLALTTNCLTAFASKSNFTTICNIIRNLNSDSVWLYLYVELKKKTKKKTFLDILQVYFFHLLD